MFLLLFCLLCCRFLVLYELDIFLVESLNLGVHSLRMENQMVKIKLSRYIYFVNHIRETRSQSWTLTDLNSSFSGQLYESFISQKSKLKIITDQTFLIDMKFKNHIQILVPLKPRIRNQRNVSEVTSCYHPQSQFFSLGQKR